MNILASLLGGLKSLFRKARVERDLQDELHSYFESAVEHNLSKGMSREEAEYAARRAIGSFEMVKDSVRDSGWEISLSNLAHDLRYGARLLRRRPGFTLLAILALALGIGANTAVFSVVNSVLIAPMPFARANRVVMVWEKSPSTGAANVVNPFNFLQWQARNRSFEKMAALIAWHVSLAGDGEPEQVENMYVSQGFFEILGVHSIRGRWFTRQEDLPGAEDVAIIGEGLWRRRYAADPAIVGRIIRIANHPVKVVGVMPIAFKFPFSKAELWQPLGLDPAHVNRTGRYLSTIARLNEGATLASAQADMTILNRQLQREQPDLDAKWGTTVIGLREQVVGDVRTPLLVLLGAVALVLLIACANVANLILMRDAGRRHEIGVRSALGASRWRLTRQMFIENALLAALGGATGVLLGAASMRPLTSLLPDTIEYSNLGAIRIDLNVLLFTAGVATLTGILIGFVPALRAGRRDVQQDLQENSRAVFGPRGRTRSALVVVEVALAMALSVGAGLLIRSFAHLAAINPGFDAAHVLSMQINTAGYLRESDPRFLEFCTRLLDRVRSLPGVMAAGTAHFLPLGRIIPGTGFWRADGPTPARGEQPVTEVLVVMPGYFAAMDIPLIRGRVLSDRDRKGSPIVVVINQTLARSSFPGENPIGKLLRIEWGPDAPYEIIGVVGDSRQSSLREAPKPGVFLSNLQMPSGPLNLVVRTSLNPHELVNPVERAIHSLNSALPISDIRTMDEYVDQAVAEPRFNTILLGAFSVLAFLLAAVGIFGVVSYSVTQRTRELAIRRALGADSLGVLRLVLSQGMLLSCAGIVIGSVAALALTQFLRKLLYGVAPTDPVTFAAVALLLSLVSMLACYFPARRAANLDPTEALRTE